MLRPDPRHKARLRAVQAASADEFKEWLKIVDYTDPNYIAPEVLASLVRIRFREEQGLDQLADRTLNERVWKRVTAMIGDHQQWRWVVRKENQPEFVQDAAQEFWKKFVEDDKKHPGQLIFAEVRFGPYLEGCVKDYVKHLKRDKNKAKYFTDMDPVVVEQDEDASESTPFIENIPDPASDAWLRDLIVNDEAKTIKAVLDMLPHMERQAVILRGMYEYEWEVVARRLDCTPPTARKYYRQGKEKVLRSQL